MKQTKTIKAPGRAPYPRSLFRKVSFYYYICNVLRGSWPILETEEMFQSSSQSTNAVISFLSHLYRKHCRLSPLQRSWRAATVGIPNITGCYVRTCDIISCLPLTASPHHTAEMHTHTFEHIPTQRMSWIISCGVSVLFSLPLYFTYFRGFFLCWVFYDLTSFISIWSCGLLCVWSTPWSW